MTARTRALFARGAPVVDGVEGRLRWELRATWLGGTRILDKLEAADFDLFAHRPKLTRADAPGILWRTALAGGTRWARDTSFYYSFLVLPAAKRRAIVAVWDFCRAVDDAVDEAPEGTRAAQVARVARGAGAVLRRRRTRDAAGARAAAADPARSTCRAPRSRR